MKIFGAAATSLFVASLASTANAQAVISLHGSGTTNPSRCYWQIMDQMQAQAKLPVKMTYRGVGSSTGQAEFVGDGVTSFNQFGSGDIPITQENYDLFPAGSIIHLPVVLGAISFFHSVPVGDGKLNISPCLLAKIMSRKITDWTDQEVSFVIFAFFLSREVPFRSIRSLTAIFFPFLVCATFFLARSLPRTLA